MSVKIVLASLCLACSAQAQTVNVPHFYVDMGGDRPPLTQAPYNANLTHMEQVDYADNCRIWLSPTTYRLRTPEEFAQMYATRIDGLVAAGAIPSNRLCLIFPHFVLEDFNSAGDPWGSDYVDLRLFRESDAIPGISAGDFPVRPQKYATNNPYRHPFGANMTPSVAYAGQAPQREWMKRFLAEYRDIQINSQNPHYNPNLPNPDAFRFDSEVAIWWYGDPNCAYMLSRLADTSGLPYGGDFWNKPVPGVPGGKSLAQLYADQVVLRGWPTNINDTAGGGLDRSAIENGVTAHQNWPYTLWFAAICEYAKNQAMWNCAYDLIQFYWPNARCSNYGDVFVDYADSPTGWMMDYDPATATNNNPTTGRVVLPTNHFPRGAIDTWDRASKFALINVDMGRLLGGSATNTPGRWIVAGRSAMVNYSDSANRVDSSPVLYQMFVGPWNGDWTHSGQGAGYGTGANAGNNWCHQQPNLYRPGANSDPARWETRLETSLRINRHEAEAAIDSFGGGHEDRLVPWLEMVGTIHAVDDPPVYDHTVMEQDVRDTLAMLRAKNIKDGAFWTGWNADTQGSSAANTWNRTALIIDQVYASRVAEISVGTGDPGASTYPPSTLEFTLRPNGQSQMVDVANGSLHGMLATEVKVLFTLPAAYRSCPTFLVNIEGSVFTNGIADGHGPGGKVYALNNFGGTSAPNSEYFQLPLVYPETAGSQSGDRAFEYRHWTPAILTPGQGYGERAFKRSFYLRQTSAGQYVSESNTLTLKLGQSGFTPFITRYDLVQLIPAPPATWVIGDVQPMVVDTSVPSPAQLGVLDAAASDPPHFDDWNWQAPRPQPNEPALLTSLFDAGQQSATIRFNGWVRTNEPSTANAAAAAPDANIYFDPNTRPVQVFYWIAAYDQSYWANVTGDISITMPREDAAGFSNEIEIRALPGRSFPPGYYAAVVNTHEYDPDNGWWQYTVYCEDLPSEGPLPLVNNLNDTVQYNFTLFSDCENNTTHATTPDGVIDANDDVCWATGRANHCIADLAGGGVGLAHPDGGVDITDLLFFLDGFGVGSPAVDLTHDGGVDIDDLLLFMQHWHNGC